MAFDFISAGSGETDQNNSRRVRTLYACVGEHLSELSFEPNQVITDGNYLIKSQLITILFAQLNNFSSTFFGARMVGGLLGRTSWLSS